MATPRTLVVTPTYNEKDNLERFVAAVREALPEANLLVVDDASPDGTGDIADAIASRDPHVGVIHRSGKLGLGTAYVQAFTQGLAEGYERFFEMDADLSHDVRYLPDFVRALDEGYDVVIGSRNIAGGGVEGWGVGRHFISKGGSIYSRTILGLPVKDLTSGYKAFSRRALEAIDLADVHSNGYSFQIEMTYRAVRRGMRVKEVPIVFVDRTAGRSKMSRRIFVEAIGMVWKLRFDGLRGRL
ncbi:MAG TPA: polyprenol monophosphomannose synthase [Polyangiaceae bacterium]|nr:polyprenol monophosphomannose synthase [Polyangiaceae bacterium]